MTATEDLFTFPEPLETAGDRKKVKITACNQPLSDIPEATDSGFDGGRGQTLPLYENGRLDVIYVGVNNPVQLYDLAPAAQKASQLIESEKLGNYAFVLEEGGLSEDELTLACAGWYLGCYSFSAFKTSGTPEKPALVWPKGADKRKTRALLESIFLLRNLINTPSNHMGPEELSQTAEMLAEKHGAEISLTREPKLEAEFPLIFAVGDSSPRRPVLIDIRRGDPKNRKVTLLGKGVCYDTGGLDLKPHGAMELMKKDMGGAAHALALANLIMSLELPVCLRVVIPAVENSISGKAFRIGDVLRSRKGITVENGNCDAEGRLVLADCMTLASEENPEMIIDFATLTGSARACLGFGIGAFFSNRKDTMDELRDLSAQCDDPLWPLPLWEPYLADIKGEVSDIANVSKKRGDTIHAALFLKQFMHGDPEWIHMDIYAWEQSGRTGRPKGGTETGLISAYKLLDKRYGE